MKAIQAKIALMVFVICALQSCNAQHKEAKDKVMLNKEIVLIKTIPGGSRSHIIILSADGELKYNVGAMSELDIYDFKNVKIDSSYSQKAVVLNSSEISEINNLISLVKKSPYKDSLVVKDNMQYYVYFDGEKKMFGYEKNFSDYPKEWRDLISYLLKVVGKLHKIPGMS